MSALHGSTILITGGTGSFGKAFIRYALDELDPRRLVIFSRDELKQYEVRQLFADDPRLRFFIGDVRDERRLMRALHGIDYVVHASMTFWEPTMFVCTNSNGLYSAVSTCLSAAACTT